MWELVKDLLKMFLIVLPFLVISFMVALVFGIGGVDHNLTVFICGLIITAGLVKCLNRKK